MEGGRAPAFLQLPNYGRIAEQEGTLRGIEAGIAPQVQWLYTHLGHPSVLASRVDADDYRRFVFLRDEEVTKALALCPDFIAASGPAAKDQDERRDVVTQIAINSAYVCWMRQKLALQPDFKRKLEAAVRAQGQRPAPAAAVGVVPKDIVMEDSPPLEDAAARRPEAAAPAAKRQKPAAARPLPDVTVRANAEVAAPRLPEVAPPRAPEPGQTIESFFEQAPDGLAHLPFAQGSIGKRHLPFHKIVLEPKVLGKGGFGEVQRCRLEGDKVNRRFAYKRFFTRQGEWKYLWDEIKMMEYAADPLIVNFIGWSVDEQNYYGYLMEYAEGGDLHGAIYMKAYTDDQRASIVFDIARGIASLHAKGIVHRDLKPGNILLADRAGLRPKVHDLGMAARTQHGLLPVGEPAWGTPNYMAPEQNEAPRTRYGLPCDIYAFGLIAYQLWTKDQPRDPPPYPNVRHLDRCPARVLQNVRLCVSAQPSDRPTAAAIVAAGKKAWSLAPPARRA